MPQPGRIAQYVLVGLALFVRSWLEGERREGFDHDLALVERLRFLAGGRTMAQAALAYVLAHLAVSTSIPGAKNPQQVEDTLLAGDRPLSAEELMRIAASVAVPSP